MPKVNVVVSLKDTLLDAQGRVIEEALHAMDYREVTAVRIGRYIELDVVEDPNRTTAELEQLVVRMCDRLLANPVTENFRIEVLG